MGAQQSSSGQRDSADKPSIVKACYYDLLEVDQSATDNEIKKAYRTKALQLHPDKNIDDVENATRRFAEVQTAYEILSDPQERAWYDSHRDAILRGADDHDQDQHRPEYQGVHLTTAKEIMVSIRRFTSTIPFTDDSGGFFSIVRETFCHLADEELATGDYSNSQPISYPSFGTSTDDYETVVRPFYASWAGFSTRKTFSWKDKYRLSDAPDRRVRRLMEKENRKSREEAIREFNEAVRFLVSFVRKRDPRYVSNKPTEAQRQQAMRDSAAAQAARARVAHQEKIEAYQEPEWAQTQPDDAGAAEHFLSSEDGGSIIEEIECVVCNKSFKSDQQFQAHERSKKHIKAVQQLRREMRREHKYLQLDDETPLHSSPNPSSNLQQNQDTVEAPALGSQSPSSSPITASQGSLGSNMPQSSDNDSSSGEQDQGKNNDDDDDYAPREAVAERLASNHSLSPYINIPIDEIAGALSNRVQNVDLENTPPSLKKLGKAKAKREKKAARQAAETESGPKMAQCNVCGEVFSSRTKLFDHIRQFGHTELVSKLGKSAKVKKKRRMTTSSR